MSVGHLWHSPFKGYTVLLNKEAAVHNHPWSFCHNWLHHDIHVLVLCLLHYYFDGTLLDGTLFYPSKLFWRNTIGWNTIGWNTFGWNTIGWNTIVIIFHHVLFMGTEVVHLLILHLKKIIYIYKYVKCMVA